MLLIFLSERKYSDIPLVLGQVVESRVVLVESESIATVGGMLVHTFTR